MLNLKTSKKGGEKKMKRLLLLVPVIIIIGCGLFGGEDFFPINIGNKWEYSGYTLSGTDTSSTMTSEINITKKDKIGDNDVFESVSKTAIRTRVPDTTITSYDTSYIRETKDAILTYATKTATPETSLLLPLKKDKTWKQISGSDTTTYTVKDQEDVTVKAGTYKKCWKVEAKVTMYGITIPTNFWYADGTGLVKSYTEYTIATVTSKILIQLTKATIK